MTTIQDSSEWLFSVLAFSNIICDIRSSQSDTDSPMRWLLAIACVMTPVGSLSLDGVARVSSVEMKADINPTLDPYELHKSYLSFCCPFLI